MPSKINMDTTSAQKTLLLFTLLFFSGKRYYLPELAVRLECSKATILRLIRTIEAAGIVAIETGITNRTRWYQMAALPTGSPQINLSRDEIEKLALCRDLLKHLLPDSIERVVSEGISKAAVLMSKAQERALATAPKAVRMVRGHIDYNPFQGHIGCLMQSIASRTVCAVTYKTPGKEPRVFEIIPMRLMVDGEVLNIEGWRVTEKGTPKIRFATTLAIHRIQECIATRRSLEDCPPLPEPQGAFGLVGDEPFCVRAIFSPEFNAHIRERVWSADQCIIDLPDGSVELAFTASSEEQVVSWLLGFGGGAQLLEPKALRKTMQDHVRALFGFYAGKKKQGSA